MFCFNLNVFILNCCLFDKTTKICLYTSTKCLMKMSSLTSDFTDKNERTPVGLNEISTLYRPINHDSKYNGLTNKKTSLKSIYKMIEFY